MLILLTDSGGREEACNFNRFTYLGVPRVKDILNGKVVGRNNGDKFAQSLFNMFCEQVDLESTTKHRLYINTVNYVAYCDKAGLDPCSEQGVLSWYDFNDERHAKGELKDVTCKLKINSIKNVLRNLSLPVDAWLINKGIFGSSQNVAKQSYSDTDIKKLLPLLVKMFNQLYDQFIERPEYYILNSQHNAYFNVGIDCSMSFKWQERTYIVYIPITKLTCLACYLLAYYTWGNTTQLFKVKRPELDGQTVEEKWAKMPVFKARANKVISIEIGDNDSLNIPRHAVKLFDKIMNISKLLNPEPGASLLLTVHSGKVQPIDSHHLSCFNRWLRSKIDLRDDFERTLVPQVGRFRASGINRFQVLTGGDLKPSIVAGNTPRTQKQHYSSGNKYENDCQIQANSYTLENSARRRLGIEDAKQITKEQMKVQVLPYEAFLNHLTPPSRNVNGSFCAKPFGDRSSKLNQKAVQRKILKPGERLACADLLKCFACQEQVIVESVDELWCILSFREAIEESAFLHLDRSHFMQNFRQVLLNIDNRLGQVNQKVLQSAKLKLNDIGRHPLWLDPDNIVISLEKI